mmetsp:Transcript_30390/g.43541  ORF Transcript_30390/g.43541 Transcript_30390/m.43541 type:complete len:153 (+) Transcript_30390:11-469(+)
MGSSQSTSHPKVEVKSITNSLDNEGNIPTKSGVRITSSTLMNDFEQQIQSAYTRGKEESKAEVQKALDLVAAQVYDNMRSQLAEIQNESIEKSQKMAIDLKNKLKVPCSSKPSCQEEEKALLACLKNNKDKSILACEKYTNSYSLCALNSIQ